MKSKTLEQYCNLSVALKFSLVLLILNLCYPAQVCSKNIVPLSFLGRTTGRINNHMLDKLINLYQKGKKRSLSTKIEDYYQRDKDFVPFNVKIKVQMQ